MRAIHCVCASSCIKDQTILFCGQKLPGRIVINIVRNWFVQMCWASMGLQRWTSVSVHEVPIANFVRCTSDEFRLQLHLGPASNWNIWVRNGQTNLCCTALCTHTHQQQRTLPIPKIFTFHLGSWKLLAIMELGKINYHLDYHMSISHRWWTFWSATVNLCVMLVLLPITSEVMKSNPRVQLKWIWFETIDCSPMA